MQPVIGAAPAGCLLGDDEGVAGGESVVAALAIFPNARAVWSPGRSELDHDAGSHASAQLAPLRTDDGRQLAELNRCAAEITKYTGDGKAERGCARQNQCRSPSAQSRWPVLSYTAASSVQAGCSRTECCSDLKASNSHFKSCSLLLFHDAAALSNCAEACMRMGGMACGDQLA